METSNCQCINCNSEQTLLGRFGQLSVTERIVPKLEIAFTVQNCTCAYCGSAVKPFDEHFVIQPCRHVLHPMCVVKSMLRYGIAQDGSLYCWKCTK